ncbi:sensor histidine kinase [Ferribacterium limneticum]|uniref:sensor histidine kinase n=1 Tax=Ferribacterium limneticum TaxID=76259 RepID=UPI001CFA43F7|nr:ATP-binding protein [Ferribacterium limneticum]UCV30227.1 sensor histidine kinase [Ferribacterium limneticum]UCV34146.1 sensor histidine kinase [Ferribacterium limneticum]
MPSHRSLRHLPILMLLLTLMVLSGFAAHRIAQQLGLADLQATGLHRLDLYTASLEREIGKYAFLPGTLGLEHDVLALLGETADSKLAPRVNAYLEQLNERAGTLAIYVIDTRGHVVASSNWRRADSFVGEDLSFRPYFREAMDSGSGRFFGIGTTRGEPGYYLASTLTDDSRTLGVAVIKVSLEQLEKSWSTVEAPAMVSDENGVVILGSVADWKFTTLRPLDEATRRAFDQTQQYNRRALTSLDLKEIAALDHGARLVSIAKKGPEMVSVYPVAGRFLAQSRPLPGTPWTLTVLSHLEQVDEIAQSRAMLALVGAAFLFMLGLNLNERRRHLKDRLAAREALQKAHDELERKVDERTADLSAANQLLHDEVAERIRAERTLRAAQDELVQAGKLAVIGQLSTGIAHELNQPLAALRTLSGNSVRFLERGDLVTTKANLERIAQLVDRMGGITGQLRAFARKSSGQLQPVALCRALDNALALLEQRLRQAKAEVVRHCPLPEPWALCDANRLEQVLINLIGNALDAMDGQPTPRLELDCAAIDGQARLTVRDHGPGLAEEALSHLFEPFFTTKAAGVGLGLGLTISAGIVRDFGGTLSGANHPDGGAIFTLHIPLLDEAEHHD